MQDQIICPHCKKPFSLPEVFAHEIQEKALNKERKEHVQEMEEMKRKLEVTEKNELQLRKEKNSLDEERRKFELEKQRQIDAEREKIRQKTLEETNEQHRLKDKEKDKMIDDLKKSLEDAQRKATQGSQQLQGEVLEVDFEVTLQREFPQDSIEPIRKGVGGADLRQRVHSPKGFDCGTILWECKRAKTWDSKWIPTLKENLRKDNAHIPAIVSTIIPSDIKNGLGFKDGVWIATPQLGFPLAMLLRKALLDATRQKLIVANRQSKAEEIYNFVTSHEFTQQVDAMMEAYNEMLAQISQERVAYEKMWKQREMQVKRLRSGVSGIYGSMQGIAGSALPTIKSLELNAPQDPQQQSIDSG